MKNTGRYNTHGSSEGEQQPGSKGAVLKNLLNITSEAEIEKVETIKFAELSQRTIFSLDQDKRFCEQDIIAMHHDWLKDV